MAMVTPDQGPIRQLLSAPHTRVVLYYLAMVLTVVLVVKLVPEAGQHLTPEALISEFDGQIPGTSSGSGYGGGGGFLSQPNVGLRTLLTMLVTLLLVFPVAWVYMITKQEVRYDRSLVHSLVLLPIAVTGVIIIVQSSLELAFGLAGIVAAVRFRQTLQDTTDAVYIILVIGIALAAGVQALIVAFVLSATFNMVVLTMWRLDVGDIYAHLPKEKKKKKKKEEALPPATTGQFPSAPDRRRGSMMIDSASLRQIVETSPEPSLQPVTNPELSVLEFNSRVLALAEDPGLPLLARIRFLSIFSTNLDEYFMVKVGALKQAVAEGITKQSIDGQTPSELLQASGVKLRALVRRQYRCFGALVADGEESDVLRLRTWENLSEDERAYLKTYYDERVFPVLTPKAITTAPGHPFPYMEDLLLSLAIVVRDPRTSRDHFVHLKIVDALPRFVQLPESNDFLPIEEVIRANIASLYPGREVLEVHPFRITRSAQIQFDEKGAANFLEALEDEVHRRAGGAVVRIEVEHSMPYAIRDLLLSELRREDSGQGIPLQASDLYEVDGLVDLGSLYEIADLPIPELDYPPFTPAPVVDDRRSIFDVIEENDVLVHHPYDAFGSSVGKFFADAAQDPDVRAIKLTLYRPGGPSPITESLLQAAAAGKDVSVFVEVKARFDEELNIYWAKQLERAGIHVVTGLVKLKTHAKLALIVRQQGDRFRSYAHIGTGNYNTKTATQYTDLGLLTADERICIEVTQLFNELTGSARAPHGEFQKLLVAPTNLLARLLEMIEREIEHVRAGRGGRIRAKMNGLADTEVIEALYKASQAGVEIDLVVRSICALRPKVPGLSDNIRVVSAVGRFLEHGRIYHFENGGDPEYYIGSADWRPRNLRRRVEVVTVVTDPAICRRLDHILNTEIHDPAAWHLKADGSYVAGASSMADVRSAQDLFMHEAVAAQVRDELPS